MDKRKYAYMVIDGKSKIGIMYHLGRYCVASFIEKDEGMLAYTIRQFKTISGAERFLLKDFSYAKRIAPNVLYETKEFIDKGEYWK